MTTNPKIHARHLERRALVYLRQSTERQLLKNHESRRLQYGLVDRVRGLGCKHVEVIDDDLGSSAGLGARLRQGFERLLAAVALGDVGLVVSLEVSRLSRTDKDWCRLLELCQLFDTLIADSEQVYDLNSLDDQLLLGIKGTLSVVELKVIRQRLLTGAQNKARRGELYQRIAPGYVLDELGNLVKDPNRRVQDAISLIFEKFRELGSARRTVAWFNEHGVQVPVTKPRNGHIVIVFKLPAPSYISSLLRNPIYAGAYTHGRRPVSVRVVEGVVSKKQRSVVTPEAAQVFIRDHHPGYIDWATFEENRHIMRNNRRRFEIDESVGPLRQGKGLLSGLLRCARCGRKLHVRYQGKSGTSPRYLCLGDYDTGGHYCLGVGGRGIDVRVGAEVVQALSPLGIEASLKAARQLEKRDHAQRTLLGRHLQQAEYEATRAFEQYDHVDPRHRLIAEELERRWNQKLEEVERIKTALDQLNEQAQSLTADDRAELAALGQHFADVWDGPTCPAELKKRIVRTVIEEVIVDEASPGILSVIIHWKGGTHTQFQMTKPRGGLDDRTAPGDLELVRRLATRHGDDTIAYVLNRLGRVTGKGKRWTEQRVTSLRSRYHIAGRRRAVPDPEVLTLLAAAKHCDVSNTTIQKLIDAKVLPSVQLAPYAPYEIRRSDLESPRVQHLLQRLRTTGKLSIPGHPLDSQKSLFE